MPENRPNFKNPKDRGPSVGTRLREIEAMLPEAMAADRYHMSREIGHIRYQIRKRRKVKQLPKRLDDMRQRLARSTEIRFQRGAAIPSWEPLEALPITAWQTEIVTSIQQHPVVIIAGETGSGKTTQLPKFCLAAGRGQGGLIGCTQPRRIAATTVAQRIADELGQPLGDAVGYKIRFQDRTNHNSFIKIMTDGILLAETQGDPALTAYDTLIVDEAHERSLNIDFLLGILKKLVQRRRDLKLIITSATIDTEKFAQAFDDAPVIEVSGRMYPVEVRYRPIKDDDAEGNDVTHVEAAVSAVDDLVRESARGDILVFMPTEQDIRECFDLLAHPALAEGLGVAALKAAADRGIARHILAWAYSTDFPTRVDTNPKMSLQGITFTRGAVPEFDQVVFSAEVGKVHGPVQTQFGYHLIKVVDNKPASVVSYEDVKDNIGQYLKQEKTRKELKGYIEELRKKAAIEKISSL